MSSLRNRTLFALSALCAALLGLNSAALRTAHAAHQPSAARPVTALSAAPVTALASARSVVRDAAVRDGLDTQATFTVTNVNDSGPGSLRSAIDSANVAGGANTIVFDPAFFNTPRTINLTAGLPMLLSNLTILGPGAHLLTIRRSTSEFYRIFTIGNAGLTVSLGSMTLSNGNPGAGEGGAISNLGTLTITNCHITGNAAFFGGGISSLLGSTLTLTQSTVSNNIAFGSSTGGGIASIGTTTITNSTISGNAATGSDGGNGGGVRLSSTSGNKITSSTITNNSAAGANSAGGLRDNLAPVVLRNNIIAGNISNATVPDASFASSGDLTSTGYNLIGNRGTLTFGGTNDQSGTGAAVLNPSLAPLGNFGGTTPVHAPLLGSPAVDKGATDSPADTDQRALPRRFDTPGVVGAGDQSDIGAVELQTVIVANTNDSGTGSLRQAITDAPALRDIFFDPPVFNIFRTITLTGGQVNIDRSMTISGPGANLLTLSGNNANRIFRVGGGLNVAISGLTIRDGSATDSVGGGIASDGNLTLTRCEVVNNGSVLGGGGVFVQGAAGTFTDCTFSRNTTTFNNGGAVDLINNSSGTFTGCTFSGNTVVGGNRGGAVELNNSSGAFTNCTVSGNTANFGAGIALFNTSGNQRLAVTNCTITNNTSQGNNGSGLLVEVAAGLTTTATLRNSIIANNSGTDNVRGLLGGALSPTTLISQGFNLTSDNSTTFLNQATDITNANPLLGALQNNGGPTPTRALLPNSPALDKGNSAGIATDQRGRTRPFDISGIAPATGGDNSDIGAFESQASIVTNADVLATPGSLRQVITDAPAGADILFDPAFFNVPRILTLPAGELVINKNLTINGPGANLLTLSGLNLNRVFNISAGVTVNLSDLTISNGKATESGGGIFSRGNLTMTRCAIVNNAPGSTFIGGGVGILGATGTFTECAFNGNSNSAVLLDNSSSTFTNCSFSGNTMAVAGGAVRMFSSSVTFTGSTFSGNRAEAGGAVSVDGSSVAFTNCTLSGNTATDFGGGIYFSAFSGTRTLAVTSCTIVNNSARNTGGIFVESSGTGTAAATIRNTIIANNTGGNTGGTVAPGSFGSITSQGYNLTNDLSNASLNQPTDIANANPRLGPLQSNGGLTQTHALLFGSPALDKGNSFGVRTDQRGVSRPVDDPVLTNATGGDGADIGAFERSAPGLASAASYKGSPFAQESIVALFGENLTGNTVTASTVPLPLTLDSTSISVRDASNTARMASLFFVSPFQLNFQIPPGTATGAATISVLRDGNVVASTTTTISAVEPALFTANNNGIGVPAALVLRVKADGTQIYETLVSLQGGAFVPAPINLGPTGEQVFLIFYGTGIRNRSALSATSLTIGGTAVGVGYAGEVGGFVGLDQVNSAALPRSLAGRGTVQASLTVDGKTSNVVTLNFQ